MNKLKPKDIRPLREDLLTKQHNMCPLCTRSIKRKDAALDHCHETGHCRQVLHKNCNSIVGRILQWARRSGINPYDFIKALVQYWEKDYSQNPIHCTHLSPTEKEIKRLRRHARRLKTERGKQKIRDKIRELRTRGTVSD